MKKNYIYFIMILFCLIVNISFVKAVECNYSVIATVDEIGNLTEPTPSYDLAEEDVSWAGKYWIKLDEYDSGDSDNYIGGNEELQNWEGKDYCPNVILVNPAETNVDWYGFMTLDEAYQYSHDRRYTGWLNDGGDYNDYDMFFIYDEYQKELKAGAADFDTTVSYTCSYDGFDINFNKDGFALTAVDTANYYNISRFFHLSEEMRNSPSPQPGVCQDVHYCQKSWTGTNYLTYTYTVFADSFDYSAHKSECEDNVIVGTIHGGTDSYDNGCRTYSKYQLQLDSFWPACKADVVFCEKYNTLKKEISNICNNILKFSDLSDDCLNACLNYKQDILDRENATLKPLKCGFSAKFVQWIANIVRWGKYLIPVVVIVLGILDFIKAIAADKDDEMKKAQGRFVKRLIAAALIFIIPFIIEFVLVKLGFDSNGCGIIDL